MAGDGRRSEVGGRGRCLPTVERGPCESRRDEPIGRPPVRFPARQGRGFPPRELNRGSPCCTTELFRTFLRPYCRLSLLLASTGDFDTTAQNKLHELSARSHG